jgi:hypothetical protein
MIKAAAIIREQARSHREQAARTLAQVEHAISPDAIARLTRYASELEQRAVDLEERARALTEAVKKTYVSSVDIRRLADASQGRIKVVVLD